MKFKIEKKGNRWALYFWKNEEWKLHQTYMTTRGAETAAMIMYDHSKETTNETHTEY